MSRIVPPPVTLTEAAKARVLALTAGKEGVVGLRVSLKSTGCSGMSYSFELATDVKPGEAAVDLGTAKLLIDPKAEMYLLGAEMDYKESAFKSGFDFTNPNEAARCGCGESFTPKQA